MGAASGCAFFVYIGHFFIAEAGGAICYNRKVVE